MDIRLQGQSGIEFGLWGEQRMVSELGWAAPSAQELTALAHLVHRPRGRTETVGAPAPPDRSTSVSSLSETPLSS